MTSGCRGMLRLSCRRAAASFPAYSFDRCASDAHVAFNMPCAIPLAFFSPSIRPLLILRPSSTNESARASPAQGLPPDHATEIALRVLHVAYTGRELTGS